MEAEEEAPVESVGENAHGIAGDEVCQHQHGLEERGLLDTVEVQPALDGEVKGDQGDVVNVREGMQHTKQPQRPGRMRRRMLALGRQRY